MAELYPSYVFGEKGVIHIADSHGHLTHICGEAWFHGRYIRADYLSHMHEHQRSELCQNCVDILPVVLLSL